MEMQRALSIGRRLAEARQTTNLSQEAAAQRLGISGASLFRYENGVKPPSLDVLLRAATLYGHSVEWFLGDVQSEVARQIESSIDAELRSVLVGLSREQQRRLARVIPTLVSYADPVCVDGHRNDSPDS